MVVTRLWKPSDTQYAHSIRAVYLNTVMMCNTVSELTWLIGEIIACRIVGSFMRGLRWPRTQSTEREEAWQRPQPVLVTMGLMLHLRHHTIIHPRSPHQLSHLYTYVYVYYYLPREKLQRSHVYYACIAPVYTLSINVTLTVFVSCVSLVRVCSRMLGRRGGWLWSESRFVSACVTP